MIDLKNPFVMREDLYAFDGSLIIRQGEIITPSILEEITQKSPRYSTKQVILKDTDLLDDFVCVTNEEKYRIIFDREDVRKWVLDLIGEITLTPEIHQELEFFKIKDYYTFRHILITTAMTVRMMNDFFHDPALASVAASTALTHDLGKSRIPLEILQSSKKLTYEEHLYILEHPWIGFLLLTYYTGQSEAIHSLVSFNHHEKIDGSGYPRGVHVDNPITQFVTIIDMFDALISHRPYRVEAFNIRGAIDYLCDEAGLGRLNMDGVKLLISYNRHAKPPFDTITFSNDHLGYRPPEDLNNYSNPSDYCDTGTDDDEAGE